MHNFKPAWIDVFWSNAKPWNPLKQKMDSNLKQEELKRIKLFLKNTENKSIIVGWILKSTWKNLENKYK